MARRKDTGEAVSIPLVLKLDTDEALKDLEKFANTTKANISGFSAAKRILDGLERSINSAFDGKNADKFSGKLLRIQQSASGAAKQLLSMRDQFKEVFERQQMRDEWGTKSGDIQNELGKLMSQERQLLAERAKLQPSLQGIADPDYYLRMSQGAEQARAKLQALNEEKLKLEKEGNKGTDEWRRITESITSAKRSIAGYESQKKRAMDPSIIASAKARWAELEQEINKVRESQKRYNEIVRAIQSESTDNALIEEFQRLNTLVKSADLEIHNLENSNARLNRSGGRNSGFKQNFYIIRTLINDISRGIRGLESRIKSFTSKIGDAAKRMLHLNKESRSTTRGLKDGFRHALNMVIRYGFGIRSLFFLFRRLRKYAIEALGEMAKAFPEVNVQMSRAITALNQMKGAIATAVQPLLNILVPALEKVAALISKIMNLIGGVFATLTGQGKIYQAVATQTDYAASLDKTGKAAKKAKKELEGYLSPIDEINKYQTKDDDKDDSGAGGGASGPGYKFVEAPISDFAKKIADIINSILKPIKEAWARVGDFVKDAWTKAFNSVKKLAMDIGRDFLKMWNQEATIKMWENIFKIVGDIGLIIANIADNLDKAWNKNNTGLHILEKIRDIFAIIIQHILNMADATVEWSKHLDFSPLFEGVDAWLETFKRVVDNIAGIFEDFYITVLLPLSKWTIEEGLPKVIDIFKRFNDEVQWEVIRARLQRVWDALAPFAKKVGEGLIIFMQDCANALRDFLNSPKWDAFIDSLIRWMNDVQPEDVARTIKLVAGAIITLKGALFLLEGIKGLNVIVTSIKTFLGLFGAGGVGAGTTAATIGEIAGATEKLASGVGVLWSKLNLFQTALFDAGGTIAFFDNIKQINKQGEINRLSDDLQKGKISLDDYKKATNEIKWGHIEQTGYTWKKFWSNFFNPFDNVSSGEALGSLFKMLKDNTHTYKGELSQLTSEYAQGTLTTKEYNEKLDELKEKYTVNGKLVKDTSLKTVKSLDDIKAGAANLATSVTRSNDDINKSYNGVKTNTVAVTQTVTNEVARGGTKMEGVANSLQKTVKTDSDKINADNKNMSNVNRTTTNDMATTTETNTSKINRSVDTMSDTIESDTNRAKTAFTNSMEAMSETTTENTSIIKNKTDEIKASFDRDKWTFSGVAEGLGETFRDAIGKVRDYWNPLADSLSGEHTIFGKTFSINLPRIPHLAQGAVIPPNREFMAVLGDQKSGTNIETPLSTMVEAFNMAMRQNGGGRTEINFLLPDRRKVAQYVVEGGRIMQTSTGKNPFELA